MDIPSFNRAPEFNPRKFLLPDKKAMGEVEVAEARYFEKKIAERKKNPIKSRDLGDISRVRRHMLLAPALKGTPYEGGRGEIQAKYLKEKFEEIRANRAEYPGFSDEYIQAVLVVANDILETDKENEIEQIQAIREKLITHRICYVSSGFKGTPGHYVTMKIVVGDDGLWVSYFNKGAGIGRHMTKYRPDGRMIADVRSHEFLIKEEDFDAFLALHFKLNHEVNPNVTEDTLYDVTAIHASAVRIQKEDDYYKETPQRVGNCTKANLTAAISDKFRALNPKATKRDKKLGAFLTREAFLRDAFIDLMALENKDFEDVEHFLLAVRFHANRIEKMKEELGPEEYLKMVLRLKMMKEQVEPFVRKEFNTEIRPEEPPERYVVNKVMSEIPTIQSSEADSDFNLIRNSLQPVKWDEIDTIIWKFDLRKHPEKFLDCANYFLAIPSEKKLTVKEEITAMRLVSAGFELFENIGIYPLIKNQGGEVFLKLLLNLHDRLAKKLIEKAPELRDKLFPIYGSVLHDILIDPETGLRFKFPKEDPDSQFFGKEGNKNAFAFSNEAEFVVVCKKLIGQNGVMDAETFTKGVNDNVLIRMYLTVLNNIHRFSLNKKPGTNNLPLIERGAPTECPEPLVPTKIERESDRIKLIGLNDFGLDSFFERRWLAATVDGTLRKGTGVAETYWGFKPFNSKNYAHQLLEWAIATPEAFEGSSGSTARDAFLYRLFRPPELINALREDQEVTIRLIETLIHSELQESNLRISSVDRTLWVLKLSNELRRYARVIVDTEILEDIQEEKIYEYMMNQEYHPNILEIIAISWVEHLVRKTDRMTKEGAFGILNALAYFQAHKENIGEVTFKWTLGYSNHLLKKLEEYFSVASKDEINAIGNELMSRRGVKEKFSLKFDHNELALVDKSKNLVIRIYGKIIYNGMESTNIDRLIMNSERYRAKKYGLSAKDLPEYRGEDGYYYSKEKDVRYWVDVKNKEVRRVERLIEGEWYNMEFHPPCTVEKYSSDEYVWGKSNSGEFRVLEAKSGRVVLGTRSGEAGLFLYEEGKMTDQALAVVKDRDPSRFSFFDKLEERTAVYFFRGTILSKLELPTWGLEFDYDQRTKRLICRSPSHLAGWWVQDPQVSPFYDSSKVLILEGAGGAKKYLIGSFKVKDKAVTALTRGEFAEREKRIKGQPGYYEYSDVEKGEPFRCDATAALYLAIKYLAEKDYKRAYLYLENSYRSSSLQSIDFKLTKMMVENINDCSPDGLLIRFHALERIVYLSAQMTRITFQGEKSYSEQLEKINKQYLQLVDELNQFFPANPAISVFSDKIRPQLFGLGRDAVAPGIQKRPYPNLQLIQSPALKEIHESKDSEIPKTYVWAKAYGYDPKQLYLKYCRAGSPEEKKRIRRDLLLHAGFLKEKPIAGKEWLRHMLVLRTIDAGKLSEQDIESDYPRITIPNTMTNPFSENPTPFNIPNFDRMDLVQINMNAYNPFSKAPDVPEARKPEIVLVGEQAFQMEDRLNSKIEFDAKTVGKGTAVIARRIEEIEGLQEKLKGEILKKARLDPERFLPEDITERIGKQVHKITWVELLQYYLKRNPSQLRRQNVPIQSEVEKEIYHELSLYLEYESSLKHYRRHLERLEQVPKKGAGREVEIGEIIESLNRSRAYLLDSEEGPYLLYYEATVGLRLREDQVKSIRWALESLDNAGGSATTVLMQAYAGFGKTKVFTAIMAYMVMAKGRVPVVYQIPQLHDVGKSDLEASLGMSYRSLIEPFELQIEDRVTVEVARKIEGQLKTMQARSRVLFMKPVAWHKLNAEYKKAVLAGNKENDELAKKLKSILDFLDNSGFNIYDEEHILHSPLQDVSIAAGKRVRIPSEQRLLLMKNYRYLFRQHRFSIKGGGEFKLDLVHNNQFLLSPELVRILQRDMAEVMADDFVKNHKGLDKQELMELFTSDKKIDRPFWLTVLIDSVHPEQKQLGELISLQYGFISEIIPCVLSKQAYVDYGESIHEKDPTVAPKENKRSTEAQFEKKYIQAALSIQYLHQLANREEGLPFDRFKALFELARKQLELGKGKSVIANAIYRVLKKNPKLAGKVVIQDVDMNDLSMMEAIWKEVRHSIPIFDIYVREIVLPYIQTSEFNITSNPTEMTIGSSGLGMTATPRDLQTLPFTLTKWGKEDVHRLDRASEVATVESMRSAKNGQVRCIKTIVDPKEFFLAIFPRKSQRNLSNLGHLVDGGKMFDNFDEEQVGRGYLSAYMEQNPGVPRCVVYTATDENQERKDYLFYYDGKDVVKHKLKGTDLRSELKRLDIDTAMMASTFYYYSIQETTGKDWQLPVNSHGILTVGADHLISDGIQNYKRDRRALADDKSVTFVMYEDIARQVVPPGKGVGELTNGEIVAWMERNEERDNAGLIEASFRHGVDAIIANAYRRFSGDRNINSGCLMTESDRPASEEFFASPIKTFREYIDRRLRMLGMRDERALRLELDELLGRTVRRLGTDRFNDRKESDRQQFILQQQESEAVKQKQMVKHSVFIPEAGYRSDPSKVDLTVDMYEWPYMDVEVKDMAVDIMKPVPKKFVHEYQLGKIRFSNDYCLFEGGRGANGRVIFQPAYYVAIQVRANGTYWVSPLLQKDYERLLDNKKNPIPGQELKKYLIVGNDKHQTLLLNTTGEADSEVVKRLENPQLRKSLAIVLFLTQMKIEDEYAFGGVIQGMSVEELIGLLEMASGNSPEPFPNPISVEQLLDIQGRYDLGVISAVRKGAERFVLPSGREGESGVGGAGGVGGKRFYQVIEGQEQGQGQGAIAKIFGRLVGKKK